MNKTKIIIIFFLISFIFVCSGCGIPSLLPNPDRDRWYLEHAKDRSKLYLVKEGMTRNEVLEKWGEPVEKIEKKDIWIYRFPDLAPEKIYLRFENDIVVKMWTS